MMQYYIKTRAENMFKNMDFLSFAKKYRKQLLDTGLDALKTASKKVVH